MYIDIKDVRNFHRLIAENLAINADTMMVRNNSVIDLNDVHFCVGSEDYALFMHDQIDAHDYEPFGLLWAYQTLFAIDKGRIPARMRIEDGVRSKDIVDLESMWEDQDILKGLYFAMRKIDWSVQHGEGLIDEQRRIGLAEEIKGELVSLCKDEWGLSTAMKWWDQYGSSLPGVPPKLIIPDRGLDLAKEKWTYDQEPRQYFPKYGPVREQKLQSATFKEEPQEQTRERLARLGSLLHLSHRRFEVGLAEHFLYECQEFGQKDKPDHLDIRWHLDQGQLVDIEYTLRKNVIIPLEGALGINLVTLDNKLKKIDWSRDWDQDWIDNPVVAAHSEKARYRASTAMNNMKALLYDGTPDSQHAYEQLALKYIAYTPNAHKVEGLERIRANYEQKLLVKPDDMRISGTEAYNLLRGRAIMRLSVDKSVEDSDWFALHPTKRMPDGYRVLERISNTEGFHPGLELRAMGAYGLSWRDQERLQEGSRIWAEVQIGEAKANRIFFANPGDRRMRIDTEESDAYGLYKVHDIDLYQQRRDALRLGSLQMQLLAIGVSRNAVDELTTDIIQSQLSTAAQQTAFFDQDKVAVTIGIGKSGNNRFDLQSIHLNIHRGPRPSSAEINRIDVADLERRMQLIDWKQDFTSDESTQFHQFHIGGNHQMNGQAFLVAGLLAQLMRGGDPEGKSIAGSLASKYLKDTPNEEFLMGLAREMRLLQEEITFPGNPVLSLKALYNLSSNRYAVGRNMDDQGLMHSASWYKIGYSSMASDFFHPLTQIQGWFSVEEYLKKQSLLTEVRMPIALSRIVLGLEEGERMPLLVDPKKFPIALFVFADPESRVLQVDIPHTMRQGNFRWPAERLPLPNIITLHRMLSIVRASPEIGGNSQWDVRPKGDNSSGEDPGDPDEGRKRGR